VQYAALPYRHAGELQVLLVTSRETGRWVLPKGWPMIGKTPHGTARREARAEAGIVGRVERSPIGSFHYEKRLADGERLTCEVHVFPLAVERQRKRWPEQSQRTLAWVTPEDAARMVNEPGLAALLATFAPADR
jgi:8-oxo-dGTP pyrophosphatase MutT (NUDIX family)